MGVSADFVTAIVPPGTDILIIEKNGDTVYSPLPTRAAADVDRWAAEITHRRNDCYYCPAGYKPVATPSKKLENVDSSGTLYVDIDCKEGGYASHADAVIALDQFCATIGLPLPGVINSGNGIHGYWLIEEYLGVPEWQPLTDALIAAATAQGLKFDHGVSRDMSRMLRVPGTHNFKNPKQPKHVYVMRSLQPPIPFDTLRAILKPWLGFIPGPMPACLQAIPHTNMDLRSGRDVEHRLSRAKLLVERCGIVADMLAKHGAGVDYDPWLGVMTNVVRLDETPETIHKLTHDLSSGWAKYVAAHVDAKLPEAEKMGPRLCATLAGEYPNGKTICSQCPHQKRKTSPIVVAQEITGAPAAAQQQSHVLAQATGVVANWVPTGWTQHADGLYARQFSKNGKSFDLRVLNGIVVSLEAYAGDHLALRIAERTDTIWIPVINTSGWQGAARLGWWLVKHRVPLASNSSDPEHNSKVITLWETFIVNYFRQELEAARQRGHALPNTPSGYGWLSKTEFCVAGIAYTADGREHDTGMVDSQQHRFTPTGTLAAQQAATQVLIDCFCPELQLIPLASFAAPFVSLLRTQVSLIIHARSATGNGKTTACTAAQAVWGTPKTPHIKVQDTKAAFLGKMAAHENLPVIFDENRFTEQGHSKRDSTNMLTQLVHTISSGHEGDRMQRDAVQFNYGGRWSTILVTTGNSSMSDALLQDGKVPTATRILEVEIPDRVKNPAVTEAINTAVDVLSENYGYLGRAWSAYFVKHRDHYKNQIAKMQAVLNDAVEDDKYQRFTAATCAVLLVAAQAVNSSGLLRFDVDTLLACMLRLLGEQREAREDAAAPTELSPLDWLAVVIGACKEAAIEKGGLLQTHQAPGAGRPPTGSVNTYTIIGSYLDLPRGPLRMHMIADPPMARVSSKLAHSLADGLGMSSREMKQKILKYGGKYKQGLLGNGITNYGGHTRTVFYEIALDDPALRGLAPVAPALRQPESLTLVP